MTEAPTVSIIMPSYNTGHLIGKAIKSVIDQKFVDWELIVVDNHSSDTTDEIVSGFQDSRISFLKIDNEGVIARSRNKGIENARGNWIAFLDSDDWWHPEKLLSCLDEAKQVDADVVYHDLYLVHKNDQRLFLRKVRGQALPSPVLDQLLQNGNVIANSSSMIKRNLLNEVGGLSEEKDRFAWEDYDLWLNAALKSEQFLYVPKTLGYYWAGGGNTSNPQRTLLNIEAIERLYFKPRNLKQPFWVAYGKGMAHLRSNNVEAALKHLELASKKAKKISSFLKCLMAMIYCRLKGRS